MARKSVWNMDKKKEINCVWCEQENDFIKQFNAVKRCSTFPINSCQKRCRDDRMHNCLHSIISYHSTPSLHVFRVRKKRYISWKDATCAEKFLHLKALILRSQRRRFGSHHKNDEVLLSGRIMNIQNEIR